MGRRSAPESASVPNKRPTPELMQEWVLRRALEALVMLARIERFFSGGWRLRWRADANSMSFGRLLRMTCGTAVWLANNFLRLASIFWARPPHGARCLGDPAPYFLAHYNRAVSVTRFASHHKPSQRQATMWDSLGSCAGRIVVVVLVILVILLVLIVLSQGGRGIFGGAGESDTEGADQKIYDTDEELEDMEGIEGGRKGKDIAIREPMFAKVASGEVTQVARLNRGPFKEMVVGNTITIRRSRAPEDKTEYAGLRRFKATITSRQEYPSFTALLEKEGHKALGYKSVKEALGNLHEFMPEDSEKESGVVAISIAKL